MATADKRGCTFGSFVHHASVLYDRTRSSLLVSQSKVAVDFCGDTGHLETFAPGVSADSCLIGETV